MVLVEKRANPRSPNSTLVLLNSDGTSRVIATKGWVARMRCANGVIYTLESATSPTLEKIRAVNALLEAAGGLEAVSKYGDRYTIVMEIRKYDPATGSSATLHRVNEKSVNVDLVTGDKCLYLFSSVYDAATTSCDIRIQTLPLSAEAVGSTVVIPAASGSNWPKNYIIEDGWLYYLAGRTKYPSLISSSIESIPPPQFIENTVCRVNLVTLERQRVLEDRNIVCFCIAPEAKTILYVKDYLEKAPPPFCLVVQPLEGSSVSQSTLLVDAVIANLWYDKVEHSVMLATSSRLGEGPSRKLIKAFHRVLLPL
jgi:hypothetical protein